MYNVLMLNKISKNGTDKLSKEKYKLYDEFENPDIILLRSFKMADYNINENLLAIGRAGAGVNNIPVDKVTSKGIVVFNTPGANANAVKELVIASILLGSRKIVEGIKWVENLTEDIESSVEKGKSQFAGNEIYGKKLGVIGLGAIGVLVANSANRLGMSVVGYDPFISVDSAWKLSRGVKKSNSIEEVFEECDYISLHIPLNNDTNGLINKNILKSAKNLVLLNFSRGNLVQNEDIKEAISNGNIIKYITDFPNKELLKVENVIQIPHLGASTEESEENCAVMVSDEIRNYVEYGTIKNSVNFPNCELTYTGKTRLCIIHKNIPKMVATFANIISEEKINIDNLLNKSKNEYAYTIIDVDGEIEESIVKSIYNVDGVIKVRLI